ncbi:MAG TPA: LytTR family DNA-binding domain-containing protein [Bryobacteraceae bacterium]|nr:LytTR family DNA-binding domain-containing protein [Bryobacteraceae bacterium]
MPERAMGVLVADDERPARRRLLDLLRQEPGIASVWEAADGQMTVDLIHSFQPDLVFLDVKMPELDGLGVIDTIGIPAMPLTIFVTAYDQHAIHAFEANALDYLLKPYSDQRFRSAMSRARTRLDDRGLREFAVRVKQMLTPAVVNGPPFERLVIKGGGTTRFLEVTEVECIEAAGMYVVLHTGGKELLYRSSLTDLEAKLDPRHFIRIHRSAIVNLARVAHLEPISHGEFEVVLKSGKRVRLSRTYRGPVEQRLRQSL